MQAGPPLRLAVLFGSVARGEEREDSDVDVGVIPLDPEIDLHAELALQAELERVAHRSVDLVRLDRASTLLRFRVAREGRPLYVDSSAAWPRFQAAAASEYFDFAPGYEAAERLFLRRLAEPGKTGPRRA